MKLPLNYFVWYYCIIKKNKFFWKIIGVKDWLLIVQDCFWNKDHMSPTIDYWTYKKSELRIWKLKIYISKIK